MKFAISALVALIFWDGTVAAQGSLPAEIDRREKQVASKVVAWRRDIHEHPELGNRETRTAKVVADHLRALGIEVPQASRIPVSSVSFEAASPAR